jgi:hypothetical protein
MGRERTRQQQQQQQQQWSAGSSASSAGWDSWRTQRRWTWTEVRQFLRMLGCRACLSCLEPLQSQTYVPQQQKRDTSLLRRLRQGVLLARMARRVRSGPPGASTSGDSSSPHPPRAASTAGSHRRTPARSQRVCPRRRHSSLRMCLSLCTWHLVAAHAESARAQTRRA